MNKAVVCVLLLAVLAACSPAQIAPGPTVAGTPVDIVKMYYAAWGNKDYAKMYGLVSDDWKAVEPTARTQHGFTNYMASFFSKFDGIRAPFASEQSNDGTLAHVSVAVEIRMLDGKYVTTNQTVSLALKQNGWKLVQPYGDQKDNS